jgi:hypothetical protein
MKNYWAVTEIFEGKVQQVILCEDSDVATDFFSKIVSEYGVEPYEEMINEHIFESDDGCVVQKMQVNFKD